MDRTEIIERTHVAGQSRAEKTAIPWLVIGMGSMAYGKERRAVTALKHMPRIRPHFLTSVWEDGTVSDLLHANKFPFTSVTIGYLGRARLRWTLINIWHMPKLFWKVLRVYQAQHCRGIVVLALQPFANVLAPLLLLKMFCDARLVFYLGDIPTQTWPNRMLCRIMNVMADSIVANSEAVRGGLQQLSVTRSVDVLYNGLALERFSGVVPLPWREQFAWAADKLVVGFAGQFAPNKGVDDFVEAASRVMEFSDSCRFVLIGKADEANAYYRGLAKRVGERKLEGKMVFVGWIPEMERAYAAVDVMVVPSRHEEPASNVVIESMASGVPVIATRTGGSPELVRDGATGFLVEKQKPEEIAEKILLLLRNRELREGMGNAARVEAHARFDAKQNALQLEQTMLEKVG